MATKPTLTESQLTPPKGVAEQAERGLKLRQEFGRGGTEVGLQRGRQLANQQVVSEHDIKAMHAYFARHKVDKRGKNWGDLKKPSAGYIAWLLWGGEPGKAWADRLRDRLDA